MSKVPQELRQYRQEQNAALANKLLRLLTSAGLRQSVLDCVKQLVWLRQFLSWVF